MQWIITFSAEDPFIGCDNHTERCSVSPAQLFCAVVPSLPNPFVQLYPVLVLCLILLYSCTLYLYSAQSLSTVYPVLVLCPILLCSFTLYLNSLQSLCTVVQIYPVFVFAHLLVYRCTLHLYSQLFPQLYSALVQKYLGSPAKVLYV